MPDPITRCPHCNALLLPKRGRHATIVKMREKLGHTYQQIGEHFGFSAARARQIYIEAKSRGKLPTKKRAKAA